MGGAGAGLGYFWVRRLHSLTGLLLASVFIFLFLIPYSSVFGGAASFNLTIGLIKSIPMFDVLGTIFVLAPLVFHAVTGLIIVYGAQVNVVAYNFYRNWMYALQRLTGILIIPFAVYHVYSTQLAFAFTGRFADHAFMHQLLAPAWAKAFYGVGVAAAAFHIGNGIAGALARWGIAASGRARDVASMALWVATFIMAVWGIRIVLAF